MQNRAVATAHKTGVIIMTYGSATTAEHVRKYFEHIYPNPSDELIKDFEHRYELVGGSPLIDITKEQARLLEQELNAKQTGESYIVRAGMLHSHPFIEEAITECVEVGATKLVGIILSPQFSSFIMDGYTKAFAAAALKNGLKQEDFGVAAQWPTEQHFIELLASRITKSLEDLEKTYAAKISVIFTTHSLPQRVVEKDPNYLEQLTATITAVQKKLPEDLEWYAAYQSAGHTPEAWLKPDLTDVLKKLADKKVPAVLIAPIQFLADHLEILYDLDVAAKAQCDEIGIAYHRTPLPNTDQLFIKALAAIAREHASKMMSE